MWSLILFMLVGFAWSETKVDLLVKSSDETFQVRKYSYKNEFGAHEIRLESTVMPNLNSKVNAVLAYGRDLDDDKLIDTWFLINPEEGVKIVNVPCSDQECNDVISGKIFKNYQMSERMLVYSAYSGLMGYLFLSIDNRYEKTVDFYKEWIDLEELRIRLDRELNSTNPMLSREQLREGYLYLIEGYTRNKEMLDKARGTDSFKLLGIDIALWATGSVVWSFLEKKVVTLGYRLTATNFGERFKAVLQKFSSNQTKAINGYLGKIKSSPIVGNASTAASLKLLSKEALKQRIGTVVGTVKLKGAMRKKILAAGSGLLRLLKAGVSNWKYVGISTGIQLGAETVAHWNEVKSHDPKEVAKAVLRNEEIQQNVAYMSMESFLMAGAGTVASRPMTKYLLCGMVALTNSTISNMFIKDKVDLERVAFDTGWETTIGAGQVLLDLKVLSKFEELAMKKGNPKLKLIGWAIVLVEQSTVAYFYSKSSSKVEKHIDEKKKPELKEEDISLMPIFVES